MGVGGSATSSATTLASGIGDAFLAAGAIAGAASVIALLILPAAATFLPKLRLARRVAVHWSAMTYQHIHPPTASRGAAKSRPPAQLARRRVRPAVP
jgi:hypothetical protein